MRTKLVGVDGCGGAGKSTIAGRIAEALGAQLVQTDDFGPWDTAVQWEERVVDQLLRPLLQNRPGRYQRYDWGSHQRETWHDVPVQDTVVLEGVSVMRRAFRPILAFTLFVETPRDMRLARGLARDGDAALPLWHQWQAAEDAYVERERPALYADLILDGTRPLT